jgi:hypothetical protein
MKHRTRTYYTDGQKALMWERWREGWTLHQIAHLFNRAHTSVRGVLAQTGGIRPPQRSRSAIALTLPEREEISRSLAEGHSIRSIAAQLGRAPSTVSREVWSSQDSVDTVATSPSSDLKLIRADAAKMAVTTGSIVKGFDVVSDVRVRKIAVLVDVFLDPFLLQASEERFGDRIDAPMSSRAHRLAQVGQDQRIELANNVSLEAAMNLFL